LVKNEYEKFFIKLKKIYNNIERIKKHELKNFDKIFSFFLQLKESTYIKNKIQIFIKNNEREKHRNKKRIQGQEWSY
jgi:hypothetical protein